MSADLCCPAHLLVAHLSLFVSLMGVWDSKPGEITYLVCSFDRAPTAEPGATAPVAVDIKKEM